MISTESGVTGDNNLQEVTEMYLATEEYYCMGRFKLIIIC